MRQKDNWFIGFHGDDAHHSWYYANAFEMEMALTCSQWLLSLLRWVELSSACNWTALATPFHSIQITMKENVSVELIWMLIMCVMHAELRLYLYIHKLPFSHLYREFFLHHSISIHTYAYLDCMLSVDHRTFQMNYLNGWKFPFPHKWKNQIKLTIWVEECSYAVVSFSFYFFYILSIDIDMFLNYILWFDFVNLLICRWNI